jgi:hypothetical protein
VSYLRELDSELGAVGIRGSRRRRILAEVEDHLHESGGDVAAFGQPQAIARRFADELATSGARRSAVAAFLVLAPIGLAYGGLFLSMRPGPDITSAQIVPVGVGAALVMLLAPQVALASGVLAVLRAWRLRTDAVAPAAEIRVLRRRVAVALAAAGITLAAIAVYAIEYRAGIPGWWQAAALATSAGGLLALAAVGRSVAGTALLRPQAAGAAGDVFDDVAPLVDRLPLELRGRPWRFCVLFASGIALLALVGGGVDEGPRNAIGEFVAICGGFAVFGRFLGLRG